MAFFHPEGNKTVYYLHPNETIYRRLEALVEQLFGDASDSLLDTLDDHSYLILQAETDRGEEILQAFFIANGIQLYFLDPAQVDQVLNGPQT